MSDNPSKEQLEIYFRNSRKYFDSLAEHYKKSDPDYYNNVMKPVMYKNYFQSGQANSRRLVISILVGAFVAMVGVAAAVYFTMVDSGSENVQPSQSVERNPVRILPDSAIQKRDSVNSQFDTIINRRLKEKKAERIY